jgi:hypothetical protein
MTLSNLNWLTRCLLLLTLAAMGACGIALPPPNVSPAPDLTATAQRQAVAAAVQNTLDAQLAQSTAQAAQAAATSTTAAGTAQAAVVLTSAAAQATSSMSNRLATGTAGAATRVARATTTAQPMANAVERLVEEGYLTRGAGEYEALLDFFREWAQINWYQWYDTGKSPTDFVVRADLAWQSASATANWFNSGCGFVFRETPREGDEQAINHYLVYLGLDGIVYLSRQTNSNFLELGQGHYGQVEVPDGQAQLMLAVEGEAFHVFVNDEHVLTYRDGALPRGGLSYALLSGTNRDFGTRCEMTNVGLWYLEP